MKLFSVSVSETNFKPTATNCQPSLEVPGSPSLLTATLAAPTSSRCLDQESPSPGTSLSCWMPSLNANLAQSLARSGKLGVSRGGQTGQAKVRQACRHSQVVYVQAACACSSSQGSPGADARAQLFILGHPDWSTAHKVSDCKALQLHLVS